MKLLWAAAGAAMISLGLAVAVLAGDAGNGPVVAMGSPPGPGPARYDAQQRLVFPADYRRWVYLSTGVNMSYAVMSMSADHPVFDSVFADPAAYEGFLKAGTWPDGTVLMLEVRGGASKGSINRAGNYQSGEPLAWEVHVKDTTRFAGGWAFFHFDHPDAAAMIGHDAACYACHTAHAAVDTTFTQFYPTLLPIATKAGTLSANYVKDQAGAH